MINKLGLASLSLLAWGGAALGADLPPRAAPVPVAPIAPAFTWTGFYLGSHSGGFFLDGSVRTRGNADNTRDNVARGRRPADIDTEEADYFSGVQAGYNVQFGSFVLGVEADISYAGVESREFFLGVDNNQSFFRQDIDFFGTVRGRAGFAFENVFVYGTGGLAYANVDSRVAFLRNSDRALQFSGRSDETEYGYAVGGGVEFLLPPALSRFAFIGTLLGATAVTVKAEYLYFDLGDRDVVVNAIPGVGLNSYTSNFETTGHIGRIGFNYKFGTY